MSRVKIAYNPLVYCYICGRLTDYDPHGLCCDCREVMQRNNERVYLLSLIKEAMQYCLVALREKMENVLEHVPPFVDKAL